MKEWVYQMFLRTGSIEAYLLLKELSKEKECGVEEYDRVADDSGRRDYQGIQPW